MAMALPLVPQDLSAAETYRQLSASLLALQCASEGVFGRMRMAVAERIGRVNDLVARLESLEEKMHLIGGSSHPLAAEASALYRELDSLRSWHPVFPSNAPDVMRAEAGPDQAQGPPPPLPSEDDGQVRGRDTADLYHFFNQTGAAPPVLSGQVRPVAPPGDLRAATSLLLHGSAQPAFQSAQQEAAAAAQPPALSALALNRGPVLPRHQERTAQRFDLPEELPALVMSLPDTLPALERAAPLLGCSSATEASGSHLGASVAGGRAAGAEGSTLPHASQAGVPPRESHAGQSQAEQPCSAPGSAVARQQAASPAGQAEAAPPERSVSAPPRRTSTQDQQGDLTIQSEETEVPRLSSEPDREGAPPQRQLPLRGQGGSSDALDGLPAQLAAVREHRRPPPALREGAAAPGDSSGLHLCHSFTDASTLDKQVDLGFPSDLEHSIMLRQRSLSSRTSLDETGLEQQRLLSS